MSTWLLATNVGLIDLQTSAKPIPTWPNHRPAQFVEPRPGSQVAAQTQRPLHSYRADSILLTRHIPHGSKPQAQRLARVLKNRPRCDRGLMPTAATDQPRTIYGAATEIMLDLAGVQEGSRVLDVAAGSGESTLMAARRVGPTGYVLGGCFRQHAQCRRRGGPQRAHYQHRNPRHER